MLSKPIFYSELLIQCFSRICPWIRAKSYGFFCFLVGIYPIQIQCQEYVSLCFQGMKSCGVSCYLSSSLRLITFPFPVKLRESQFHQKRGTASPGFATPILETASLAGCLSCRRCKCYRKPLRPTIKGEIRDSKSSPKDLPIQA